MKRFLLGIAAVGLLVHITIFTPPLFDTIYSGEFGGPPTLGLFGLEIALADFTGGGGLDLVLSSGGSESPQPLVLYRNDSTTSAYEHIPQWYSETFEHRGVMSVGDVDGDGTLDIAVPVLFNHKQDADSGWIDVFLNKAPGREYFKEHYRITGLKGIPLAVALGDADGDGRLDVAVVGVGSLDKLEGIRPPPAQIYFNRGGRLDQEHPWSGPEIAGAAVLFSDLDQDGWLDLVTGGLRVNIFAGGPGAFTADGRSTPLQLEEKFEAAYGLAAGRIGQGPGLSLIVSENCRQAECDSLRLLLYAPDGGSGFPSQRGTLIHTLDNGSRVRLFDVNDDGHLELIATQMGDGERGAPVLFFQGTADGFNSNPWNPRMPFRGTGIAVGDLKGDGHRELTETFTLDGGATVTLGKTNVTVAGVAVNGRDLRSEEFGWVAGQSFVSIRRPSAAGATVTVRYRWSPTASVAIASNDPGLGPRLMFSWCEKSSFLDAAAVFVGGCSAGHRQQ